MDIEVIASTAGRIGEDLNSHLVTSRILLGFGSFIHNKSHLRRGRKKARNLSADVADYADKNDEFAGAIG